MTERSENTARRTHLLASLSATTLLGLATLLVGASGLADDRPWRDDGPRVSRYIELNHAITDGMVTFPGISVASFYDWAPRFENSALIDEATLLGITGTYIDAPYHVDPNGAKIADYPLEKLVNLPVLVVTKPRTRLTFEIEDFKGLNVKGKAVLLFTGHDQFFGTPQYGVDVPYLSVSAAQWLVKHKVAFVGIDTPLIDNYADLSTNPVHHELLDHGVVICEDMTNLAALPWRGAFLTAVPPRVPMTSFPARVFATVYDRD